jgi:hypothetical protein
MTPIAGPRAAVKPNDAERSSKLAGLVPASSYVASLRAELIGTDRATALGVEAHGPSPIFTLCRALVEAGHDPATPLHAYRGDVPALRVRSIGEAACLEVNGEGTGFRPTTKPGRASLVHQNEEAAASIGCGAPLTSELRS